MRLTCRLKKFLKSPKRQKRCLLEYLYEHPKGDTLQVAWKCLEVLRGANQGPVGNEKFSYLHIVFKQIMCQDCCMSHKCAHFYSFSKLGATLGTLPPGPAAQVQSRGQNRLWTLRYTPEEAISEKILKFRSHSSDICQKCNFY